MRGVSKNRQNRLQPILDFEKIEEQLTTLRDTACITAIGAELILSANIELSEDVTIANHRRGLGAVLLRGYWTGPISMDNRPSPEKVTT